MSNRPNGAQPEQSKPADKQRRDWLVNALIPALAALSGALIGAMVSVFITIEQINANQHQAVDSFLRPQRQSAYAALLADAYALQNSSSRHIFSTFSPAPASKIDAQITKVTNDYYDIAILGPTSVAVKSYKVWMDASCIGEDAHIGDYGFKCHHTLAQDINNILNDMGKANNEMTRVIEGN
jgi:hypothetical protein